MPKKYKLGKWVRRQRGFFNKGVLSKGRIDRLDSIGFVWSLVERTPWIDMYTCLVAYKEQYRTTLVPTKYDEEPVLCYWVSTQRNTCKKKDRMQLLNDIDFVWDARVGGK